MTLLALGPQKVAGTSNWHLGHRDAGPEYDEERQEPSPPWTFSSACPQVHVSHQDINSGMAEPKFLLG